MKKKELYGLKFEGVDLFDVMGSIVDSHVEHYRSDFDIDRQILLEAAGKKDRADRTWLWLCRTCGTWLLRERDVFICGTRENQTFRFYAEQSPEGVTAYAVEVSGMEGDAVIGNLYTLDYARHYRHVVSAAQKAGGILFVYEDGQKLKPADSHIYGCDDEDYGKFRHFEFQPESMDSLAQILAGERSRRNAFKSGNFVRHAAAM